MSGSKTQSCILIFSSFVALGAAIGGTWGPTIIGGPRRSASATDPGKTVPKISRPVWLLIIVLFGLLPLQLPPQMLVLMLVQLASGARAR